MSNVKLKFMVQMNKDYTASGFVKSYGVWCNNKPMVQMNEEEFKEFLDLFSGFQKIIHDKQTKLNQYRRGK